MQQSYFDYYRASQLVDKFLALAIRNSRLTLLCSKEPNTKPILKIENLCVFYFLKIFFIKPSVLYRRIVLWGEILPWGLWIKILYAVLISPFLLHVLSIARFEQTNISTVKCTNYAGTQMIICSPLLLSSSKSMCCLYLILCLKNSQYFHIALFL
jgi:hypothetical protein